MKFVELIRMPFGKHKGKIINQMTSIEETKYLHWLINSNIVILPSLKKEIQKHLNIKI